MYDAIHNIKDIDIEDDDPMFKSTRTFAEWVINWIWYLRVQLHEDGSVTIQRYWREHGTRDVPSTEAKDAEHIPFEVIETDGRIAAFVIFDDIKHPVRNSEFIFSYH